MAYKNIEYCVHNALYELGDSTTKNYNRFLQFAFRGYRELNLGMLPSIKVAYLTVGDNLTAPLPHDYVDYTAIGICVGKRIYTLTLNENLCLDRKTDECCDPITEEVVPDPMRKLDGGYWFMPSWRNNKYVGEQYGLGGGINFAGYYRIDYEKNRIQFANLNAGMEIILEYKSNGIECDGSALIPEECIECLIAYIMWKRVQNNIGIPLYEKNRAQQEYFMQYEKSKFFLSSFTADEYLDERWSSARSSPKR